MEVNKEIEEMLNALGDPTPKGAEEKEEEKEEEEDKKEEKPDEKEEEKSEEKEEEKEEDKEEDKEEEKEETEKEKTKRETEEKAKETEALTQIEKEKADRKKAEEDATKAEEEKRKKAEEPLKLDEHDFIGDIDLEDLTHDKAALNKLLNAVYSKGVGDAKKIATEGVLMTIPDIVKHNIALQTAMTEAKDNFYKENEDLKPFKAVVAAVFEEVAAKNSGKKIGEIMALTAPEVRTRLKLKEKAVEKKEEKKEDKKEDGKPRLHGTKSGNQRGEHREKPETKGLADDIAAMNKALGR